jgi:LmbE family N-acetylglucosaminyl deacetylase
VAFAVKLSLIHETKMTQKIVRATLALLFVSLLITAPRAQQTVTTKQSPEDRVALYQALLDLTNPWTVMCIAAHPDDEDGTSLIVMRRKYGAHTVSLFSTFGEGGQNAIGPELYEELGAIRARETMAAAEIQGSEPYFLGLKDYGFSKTADEAFKIWGHEEALRRMVLQIRKLRPDIIITNHSVTNNDHGQHQATARLTVEAFDAAADPKRFPEQLKDGVTVWQVQRLFVRAGRSSNPAPTETRPVVTIDPNERDPIRDTIYAEEALRGLQKHATQGPWPKTFAEFAARFRAFTGQSAAPGQLPLIRYVLVREKEFLSPLPPGSHNFLDGIALTGETAKQLSPPTIDGKPLTEFIDQRDRIVTTLISAEKDKPYGEPVTVSRTNASRNDGRLSRMNENLNNALASTLGISAKLISTDTVLIPGQTAKFQLSISNGGSRGATAKRFWFGEKDGKTSLGSIMGPELPPNFLPGKTITVPLSYDTPLDAPLTVPRSQHLYDGTAEGKQLTSGVFIDLGETSFRIVADTFLDVAPPLEITNISPSPAVRTPPDRKPKLRGTMDCTLRDFDFKVRVTNNQDAPFSGRLIIGAGFGRRAAYHPITIAAHDKADLTVSVPGCPLQTDPKTASEQKAEPISFNVVGKGTTKPLARLEVPIVFADARVAPNLRVGYVRGFDYSLPNALAALGVESKELSVDEVKTADLQKYNAIIVDNRVYESTPGLIETNQKLLDYAKNGGTLIVFYHKSFEWNPDERRKRPQLAPYKLILGDERIVDENAPITFLEPKHPLLNFPNKMGQEDFANWIQERGLYYPKEWDPQFHALLQSNDASEAPLKGGLLVADYGRGRYIYTSMVWYRELRAGVPGAYRMLANMISYGAK